jgi:hypothetical protein
MLNAGATEPWRLICDYRFPEARSMNAATFVFSFASDSSCTYIMWPAS